MERVSTEEMRVCRKWFWIGDVLRKAQTDYSSKLSIADYNILFQYLCKTLLSLQCKPIGFRAVTRAERKLSRFNRAIDFLNRFQYLNRTTHLMLLVETPDKRRAQLMFSCSLDQPQSIECIDIDKVHMIRFVIWIGIQLSQQFLVDTSFVCVWCTNVLPLCHNLYTDNKHKLRQGAWVVSKKLKSV